MSDQNQFDNVQQVEEEILDTSVGQRQRRQGMSPAAKFGLIIGGGIAAIGLAMYFAGPQTTPDTRLVSPPSLDATPGGSIQAGSAEFQESLRQENQRRAELAERLGVTSMPTPEVILQPNQRIEQVPNIPEVARQEVEAPQPVQQVSRRILPTPDASPRVVAEPAREVRVSQEAQQPQGDPGVSEDGENPYINAMISQMGMISSRQAPTNMQSAALPRSERAAQEPDMGAEGNLEVTPDAGQIVLRPGDILYGETLTTVTSDAQSPVLVEIVTGDQKGARLVGQFTANRRADNMVVNFTSMTLADGTAVQVNAFAVDGRSAEMAVASDIERRYMQRYGPILAATFLSSFARSQATPDRIVSGGGYDIDVELLAPSLRQSAFAGVAAATDIIAQDIAQSAPVGALIRLRAGYPIAVLIVDPVTIADPATLADADQPAAN